MTAYYNDIDPYCCAVLRKQIAAGNLPAGEVDDRDICTVDARDLCGFTQIHLFAGIGGIPYGLRLAGVADDCNVITGGFPCQDISDAGRRAGIGGARSGLWTEFARLIRTLRPDRVFVENVAALTRRGLGTVLGDLAAGGYDAAWDCVPAALVGAPHARERVFILAHRHGVGLEARHIHPSAAHQTTAPQPSARVSARPWRGQLRRAPGGRVRLLPDAELDGVADGVPGWLDRLRGLGNAVVPQAAAMAWLLLQEAA